MCVHGLSYPKSVAMSSVFSRSSLWNSVASVHACAHTYARWDPPPKKKQKTKKTKKREQREYIYTPSLNYTSVIQSKSFLNKHRIDGATNQKHGDVHTPPLPLPLRPDVQYGRLRRNE